MMGASIFEDEAEEELDVKSESEGAFDVSLDEGSDISFSMITTPEIFGAVTDVFVTLAPVGSDSKSSRAGTEVSAWTVFGRISVVDDFVFI